MNACSPRRPAAITVTHRATRAGHGSATANHVTAHASASHVIHALAAKSEGIKSIRLQEAPAECRATGIGWDISGEQIARDIRVGQFEKVREGGAFVACGLPVTVAQVSNQQEIEFLHAAPALPREAADFSAGVQASSF
jgi:hypothetical protein